MNARIVALVYIVWQFCLALSMNFVLDGAWPTVMMCHELLTSIRRVDWRSFARPPPKYFLDRKSVV